MIAIDATPLAESGGGGVRQALSSLLLGLESLEGRPEIHLVAPGPLTYEGPCLDGVHTPPRRPLSTLAFRRRFLPRTIESLGADVLYVPFAATGRVSVPVVAFVHELPHVQWGAIEGRLRRWRFVRATRAAAQRARGICVPTRATATDLIRATGVLPERVHVTGNAFDPGPWSAARPLSAGVDVVAVGTGVGAAGTRKKGMDVLLEAAAALPDLTFQVVGLAPARMPPNMTCRSALDDEALRSLVAGAGLLVHPARSEGFGYPPLEAMAASTPVVATRGGALEEVLGDAAVLVAPGDAEALAAGIRRVLEDAGLQARLRERGRERAEAFLPSVVARRVLDVLEEVVS